MGFFSKLFGEKKSQNPEGDFMITITDEIVRVEHPNRKTEEILWKDINEIRFINTVGGPFTIDVWLALIGDSSGCIVPQGTKGCEQVYDIVSKYDGFDFESVIKSMSSTDNEQFLLWTRK
jgi:hypothetical protein